MQGIDLANQQQQQHSLIIYLHSPMILLHISYFTVSDSGFLAFMLVLPHHRFLDLRGRIMTRIL